MRRAAAFILASVLWLLASASAQTILTADGLAAFGTNAASGGGGGGCTASYSNTGGQGNRSSIITVDDNSTSLVAGPVNLAQFVNGNYGDNNAFWQDGVALDGTTYFVRFDFGSGHSAKITEATYYQSTATAQGVWQWQGSNDNSSWTSIGSTFTLGGATTQVIATLSGNTTFYRYYRMLGISGNTSFTPWIRGMDFKLCYT